MINFIAPGASILENPYFLMLLLGFIVAFGLFVFGFILLVTNRESWFWFFMRWSDKLAIAEFDDTGRVYFKAEKNIGQGVIKGDGLREYSVTPRNISNNLESFIQDETDRRYMIQVRTLNDLLKEGEELVIPPNLHIDIRAQVEEAFTQAGDALSIASDLNRFRAFTAGTKSPFFIRYSGKAVVVNPLLGTVISGGKYARVQDLKTFISKMITPSQIKYIATLSEMIGAKQIGGKSPWGTILLMLLFIVFMIIVVFVVLPSLGIKVF